MKDGTVRCWGQNNCGQLGNGLWDECNPDSDFYEMLPTVVCESDYGTACPPLDDIVSLALGEIHSCALSRDGGVYCWGYGSQGQLGNGTREGRQNPTGVCLSDAEGCDTTCSNAPVDFIAISSGNTHMCGLTAQGIVKCWGDSRDGKLGNGFLPESAGDNRCNPLDVCSFGTGNGCLDGSVLGNAAVLTCEVRSVSVVP
jgi:alpha-tubulin suppressor-like RCC1 family protein